MLRSVTNKPIILAGFLCLSLCACGGDDPAPQERDSGDTDKSSDPEETDTKSSEGTTGDTDTENPTDTSDTPPSLEDLPKIPLSLSNPTKDSIANAAFTFAHPFGPGVYPGDQHFELQIEGRDEPISLQTNPKALHPDGSLRHAIFSGQSGALSPDETLAAKLVAIPAKDPSPSLPKADALKLTKDMTVNVTVEGKSYHLKLKELLEASKEELWIDGDQAKEWHVRKSLVDDDGKAHPHLFGIFNFRVYGKGEFAMVDLIIENNWTYQAKPMNILYDVEVLVDQKARYAQKNLYHLHGSRWKKKFWLGDTPQVHVGFDPHVLMQTNAVPNYDPALVHNIAASLIDGYQQKWKPTIVTQAFDEKGDRAEVGAGAFEFSYDNYGPMGTGLAQPQMGTAGGRIDIGPLPRWVASYLLNQDPVSKKVALGMADLAGSWPMHYRDKATGNIVSIDDYPYIATIWNQGTTRNPDTGKKEGPTPCEEINKAHCRGVHTPDTAHQPAFAYVPYLLTGDHYFLEELHFWTNFNFLAMNPSYRGLSKGLYTSQQDRGQAWSMRTLGHSAYITPDDHPFKTYFSKKLANNLEAYKERYLVDPPNEYGALYPNYSYPSSSPWMDDFFTWAMGNLVDMGFKDAQGIHKWKSKFPIQRMGYGSDEAKAYCWILGSAYHLQIAPAKGEPMYQTIDQVYERNNRQEDHTGVINLDDKELPCGSQEQADAKGIRFEEMIGYGRSPAGFSSNMRPALAVAADSGAEGGKEAWKKFIERKTKPDYSGYPVWAIVPRSYQP